MNGDTPSRLQRATRFFARLVSFDIECPHCGTIYQVRYVGRRRRNPLGAAQWDPWTARLQCGTCRRSYVLGVVAWPIRRGINTANAPPRDQVPSPRQLAQLRAEGGGWWMPDEEGQTELRPTETNLTTEEERPDAETTEDDE